MNPLFHAIAFLTRIPVPRLSAETKDWEKSVAYYPVVGLLIGTILWGASLLAQYVFPLPLAAVIVLSFWIFITGGLHLDGWMDLADGLGSSRTRERIFEIMKDSRVGAMGVTAAIVLFMIKGTALYEIAASRSFFWLILPPFIARFSLVAAIWFWPYITERGMGTGLRSGLTGWLVLAGFLFTSIFAIFFYGWAGGAVLAAAFVTGWLFLRNVSRRLGGLTGDCYGALVEWMELNVLLFIVIAERFLV
jgi:adenosylcobinamide-GDP ribazoletransferase